MKWAFFSPRKNLLKTLLLYISLRKATVVFCFSLLVCHSETVKPSQRRLYVWTWMMAFATVPKIALYLFDRPLLSRAAHGHGFSAPGTVFMWVPTLQRVVPRGVLPTGLIFSSFMVCITIGGVLCSIMLRVVSVSMAMKMSRT